MLPVEVKKVSVFILLTLCCLRENVIVASDQSDDDGDSNGPARPRWSEGDPRWCLDRMWKGEDSDDRTQMYEVLPGLGWDNLRNVESAPVIHYNYSKCRLTDDGKFLIPDNVFIIPLKRSKLQTFAELIDEWDDLKSVTARTINLNPGFSIASYSISGKFSREYAKVKGTQIEDKTATIRIQLRYLRYKAKLRPGSFLSPEFKAGLLAVATHLEMNQTDRARYETEVLIRNFGTHYLTSVTAGAGLVKEDYVKRSYVEENEDNRLGMLSSANGAFKESFSLDLGLEESQRVQNTGRSGYLSNLTHSYTETLGGDVFLAGGMTARDWAQDLDSNLVAMDRAGDPLYMLITQKTLPELPLATVEMLEGYVRNAINLYYKMNVIPGCTDRTFAKFSITANFDDGSCKTEAETGLALGGIYQTCEAGGDTLSKDPCDDVQKRNALTGDLTCPDGFTAVLLHEGKGPGIPEYKRRCKWCNLVSTCCENKQRIGYAHYKTYWCAGLADKLSHEVPTDQDAGKSAGSGQPTRGKRAAAQVQPKTPPPAAGPVGTPMTIVHAAAATAGQGRLAALLNTKQPGDKLGYSFGGVYTSSHDNLVTNGRSCPEGFYPRSIFFDLNVCISDDDETASSNSIPFGGFFSCSMGNPIAAPDGELARKGGGRPLEHFLAKSQSGPGKWPKKCPTGYSQHLAIEVNGCAIHYCAESGAMRGTNLPKVRSPPFSLEPPESEDGPELVFDKASMTWIAKTIVQGVQQSNQQLQPDQQVPGRARTLQTSGSVPGPGVGTQRAAPAQHSRDGYVEMRTEVFAGTIVGSVSLIVLTVAVAVYMVRWKSVIDKMADAEVMPLRGGRGNVNPNFEQTEGNAAEVSDRRRSSSYTVETP